MIQLTEQQRRQVDSGIPARVVDVGTNAEYVLLRGDAFERLRALFEDVPVSNADEDALIREAGLAAGWDDPDLDVYNNAATPQS